LLLRRVARNRMVVDEAEAGERAKDDVPDVPDVPA